MICIIIAGVSSVFGLLPAVINRQRGESMTKKRRISIVVYLMIVLFLANASYAETDQSAMPSALKEMSATYEDQFNTHTNNWPEYDNSTASVLIEDGEYHIEHKGKKGFHIVLHPYGVSTDMDSMIHVSVSTVRGSGDHSYGFVFGAKDAENNYSFQIRNNNVYSIEKIRDGKRQKLAGGPIDNIFINKNSKKTLKIVKQRDKVRFYVDEYYLDELVNADFPGDLVGFIVDGKVKISVDWTRTQIKFKG
jgi:hypothetical protein